MRVLKFLIGIILFFGGQIVIGQVINDITIQPTNPTANDSLVVISDFSYFGNCAVGSVDYQLSQSGSVITIYPEYCGFGEATACQAVDTFSLGLLANGMYTLNIEYHQGTVCGGSFDTIIAGLETSLQIGALSATSIISKDIEISIFPNPTSAYVSLRSNSLIKELKLFDMTGKEKEIILRGDFIDLAMLAPGLYFLTVETEKGILITKRIIKNSLR